MVYKCEVIDGFFAQTILAPFTWIDGKINHIGLLDNTPQRWGNLTARIKHLNEGLPQNERIKLLFLARHGQGYHNVAQDKYQHEWEGNYALRDGDSELTWGPDPFLTPLGEQQARECHDSWLSECRDGLPKPQAWYCSPMRRAASTLMLTFDDLRPVHCRPKFVEELREHLGMNTCDKRSSKSILAAEYPAFDFYEPFDEEDVLWVPDYRERESEMVIRMRAGIDKIFDMEWDNSQYISITAHFGAIRAMCAVLGHNAVALPTGGILPVVVKITRSLDN